MKKLFISLVFILGWALTTQAQNQEGVTLSNENYVYTRTFQKAMSSTTSISSKKDVISQAAYFDGLGRPLQQLSINATPSGDDLLTHFSYDPFGRQVKEHLPFPKAGTPGSLDTGDLLLKGQQYYKGAYPEDFNGVATAQTNPYSETFFESSPLNRTLKQAAPGKDWKMGAGNEILFAYESNEADDDVAYFYVNYIGGDASNPELKKSGEYSLGELYKTITYDENYTSGKNHSTEEYTDKNGRVVLKKSYSGGAHSTYYVYDDHGNLSYVLPPKVTVQSISTEELDELCYQYKYDHRNRLVEKKIPGKDWEYIVYTYLDEPYLTQDANLRANNEWLYTAYDAFGRVAYTGLDTAANGATREAMQNSVNNLNTSYVTKTSTPTTIAGTNVYYTKLSFPVTVSKVYTINYYDNYTFDTDGLSLPTAVEGEAVISQVQGLATGSKVRVLGTDDWITTIMGYDTKGRVIYTASKNNFLGTVDIVESKLDFVGRILKTRTSHTKNGATIVTIDNFSYDEVGRLLSQTQCIGDGSLGFNCTGGTPITSNLGLSGTINTTQIATNSILVSPTAFLQAGTFLDANPGATPSGTEELIVLNSYDELGLLETKKVGGTVNSNPLNSAGLQAVDYTYNVRGWLKQINDPTSLGTDLFAFGINYNTESHGATKLYNGNISETEWKTANDNALRWYTYGYDALNRLTDATDSSNNYSVSGITYDKNGNIETLFRRGHTNFQATGLGVMDNLSYTYDDGNKLISVEDTASQLYGFKNGATQAIEYTYDANGNMITDANKGITAISYNHLNLPTSVGINGGTITYIYDATGIKQRKTVSTGATTDYAGNYIYEDGSLQFFNTPEGYVEPVFAGGSTEISSFNYTYQCKDHLGNIRLSYTEATPVTEVDEDYESNVGGWSLTSGTTTSLDNGKLKATIVGEFHKLNHFINSVPGERLQISFDFENIDMVEPVFAIRERINGTWQNVNLEALLLTENKTYQIAVATAGEEVRFFFEKSAASDNGAATSFKIDNFRISKSSLVIKEENNYYPFGLQHKGYNNVVSANANSVAQKFKYNGKELEKALGYRMYEYEARHYDAALARFVTIDPLAEDYSFQSPFAYAVNDPIRFIDKLGMGPDDVILRGSNGSSITLVTDLVDLDIDASSLGVDFGGNYSFEGEDLLVAGLDIAGIFDPTGVADIAAGSIEMKNGNFWSGIASYAGVAPLIGDAAKLGKIPKHLKTINKAIDAVKSGKKSVTAEKAANLAKAESKGIPKSQLGPSGKPKIHKSKQSTNKRAKDAARNNPRSNTKPVKHSSDKGQKTHYHSTRNGEKLKGKDNTHYTDESTKKNGY